MEKLFTCREAAEALAVKETTVREWIKTGRLPASRIGRLYRIKQADLEKVFDKKEEDA